MTKRKTHPAGSQRKSTAKTHFSPPRFPASIPKLRAEAARLKTRIDNLTARYDATVEKITELENLEIVGLVRAENMSIEQLAALIKGGVPDED